MTRSRTFWVDLEDFFQYFEHNPRPSGIQRLVFETIRVLPERARASGVRIVFARHSFDDRLLREVAFTEVAALFGRQASAGTAPKPREAVDEPEPVAEPEIVEPEPVVVVRPARRPWPQRLRHWLIRCLEALPRGLSGPVLEVCVLQVAALRTAKLLMVTPPPVALPAPVPLPAVEPARVAPPPLAGFGGQAGDVLLVLGAPWATPEYGAFLAKVRSCSEVEVALLLYDLIPVRRPEWCAQDLVTNFAAWLAATLPQCDRLMAISQASARDVEAYAREIGLQLARPVVPVPIGTGFQQIGERPEAAPAGRPWGLPAPGSYVLFVSTLEARKNHVLLFRVWRRLLTELPRAQVPTLVFAGRVGWLVQDLMQQLENTAWFDGKIRLLRDPTDRELEALYEGCQFTIFPSLFEGWGLPVSESLAHGRPCLASDCTSLRESGGELARYFNAESIDDAVRAVRAIIEDPAGLAAWQARVARDFRHVPWERTADAILAACEAPPAAVREAMADSAA